MLDRIYKSVNPVQQAEGARISVPSEGEESIVIEPPSAANTLSSSQTVRIFKIDTDFIRQAKADGTPLEVERLVQRKIGVPRHIE